MSDRSRLLRLLWLLRTAGHPQLGGVRIVPFPETPRPDPPTPPPTFEEMMAVANRRKGR